MRSLVFLGVFDGILKACTDLDGFNWEKTRRLIAYTFLRIFACKEDERKKCENWREK